VRPELAGKSDTERLLAALPAGLALGGGFGGTRLGSRTLIFFIMTTLLAASLGAFIVNVVKPGNAIDADLRSSLLNTFAPQAAATVEAAGQDLGVSTFVNIVPRNPLEAAAKGDLIAFIFFTIVFGIAMTKVPKHIGDKTLEVFEGIAHAITAMIGFAMRLAPLGVAGLAFAVTARLGLDLLAPLGLYFGVVMVGLAVYQFGVLGMLVKLLGHYSPLAFFKKVRLPLITAFSTASSSATRTAPSAGSMPSTPIFPSNARFPATGNPIIT